MLSYRIERGALALELRGWDRLLAIKRGLTIAVGDIVEVRALTTGDRPPWVRAPGTYIPGLITAGTYYGRETRKEFWCTRRRGAAVLLDLQNAEYTRVVVDLPVSADELHSALVGQGWKPPVGPDTSR